jgi:hypothetical protein
MSTQDIIDGLRDIQERNERRKIQDVKKDYLVQVLQDDPEFLASLKEGDIISFDMPPFCSGDYHAIVFEDEGGLNIDHRDNYFAGCRDYSKRTR